MAVKQVLSPFAKALAEKTPFTERIEDECCDRRFDVKNLAYRGKFKPVRNRILMFAKLSAE